MLKGYYVKQTLNSPPSEPLRSIQELLLRENDIMCSRRTSFIAVLALCLFHLSVDRARTNECDLSEDNKEDNQCAGHVIETQSVWTEIQCADMCLRSHLCDRYIFDRQKSGKHDNCELLNTALQPQMSSGGNQHNPSSVCKTMRLKNGKHLRDILLGTDKCPEWDDRGIEANGKKSAGSPHSG